VHVPTLAQVLGMSMSAVYMTIRKGRFVMPSRMLGSMPAVKIEDLLDWYCGGGAIQCADQVAGFPGAKPAKQSKMHDERERFIARVEEKNRLVAQMLAEMGIEW